MATNQQVAHIWAQGNRASSKGSNFYCESNRLYSYHTCVGMIEGGVIFLSADNMTSSTAKQLSYARHAANYRYFASPAFSYGTWDAPSVEQCIQSAAEAHAEDFKALCRKRSNLEDAIESYTARTREIELVAARFQVEVCDMPEATGDLKAAAKKHAAQEKARKAEALQRQEEKERAQRIIDQGQLDAWLQRGEGSCPYIFTRPLYRGTHGDLITIKGDVVVTSQGAEAPLEHVRKAVAFYLASSNRYDNAGNGPFFAPYHTNGHKIHLGHFTLESIDEAGNVKAGCHFFKAAELARFIAQWREVM